MEIRQFVMAYRVEHDRLRAVVPEAYTSLRPVLRINAEIRGGKLYLEFNTPVARDGFRGWLNIGCWDDATGVTLERDGGAYIFRLPCLKIRFAPVGIRGGCPAERDNDGCIYQGRIVKPDTIANNKEFCDCAFAWRFADGNAHGESIGKTLPAAPEEVSRKYPRQPFTPEAAAAIPCEQVLGTYTVIFSR